MTFLVCSVSFIDCLQTLVSESGSTHTNYACIMLAKTLCDDGAEQSIDFPFIVCTIPFYNLSFLSSFIYKTSLDKNSTKQNFGR